MRVESRETRYTLLFLFLGLVIPAFVGCDCGPQPGEGLTIKPRFLTPSAGARLSGRTSIQVGFSEDSAVEEVRWLTVTLTPQGKSDRRLIASLHKAPFQFRWDSHLVKDGFYKLEAIAYDSFNNAHSTGERLVQVLNAPPRMWFVNCVDGQFIRGTYPVVVEMQRDGLQLKQPPILQVNDQAQLQTSDPAPPYRFPVTTTDYPEGQELTLRVQATDTLGNAIQLTCRPRIDNELPVVRFVKPTANAGATPLGRRFTTTFDAQDNIGIKEVRLWVDGSQCPDPKPSGPINGCEAAALWLGKQEPLYPIQVVLSQRYQDKDELLPVQLMARAIDLAGNFSEPAQLLVYIDLKPPEIYIQSPGHNEVITEDREVSFQATVRDIHGFQSVAMVVEGGKQPVSLYSVKKSRSDKILDSPRLNPITLVSSPFSRLGFGRRVLVVRAVDKAGNVSEARRPFRVGCGDSIDCPVDKVCHNSVCILPAGQDQPCGPDIPCIPGTRCIVGARTQETFCSPHRQGYCRRGCNPGNPHVQRQSCHSGFYCSVQEQACLPGDGCKPLTNEGCQPHEQCVPRDEDAAVCFNTGHKQEGQACENSCSQQNTCQRGLLCSINPNTLKTECRKLCSIQKQDCPAGYKCNPTRNLFGRSTEELGACYPQ